MEIFGVALDHRRWFYCCNTTTAFRSSVFIACRVVPGVEAAGLICGSMTVGARLVLLILWTLNRPVITSVSGVAVFAGLIPK